MKREELFIGALVNYLHTEDGVAPYKEPIRISAEDMSRDECVIEAHFEPIPITPEILVKFGFKKDTGGEECWGCKIGWLTPHHYNRKYFPTSWEVQICARNSFSGVIKYVHQLQAALRVCKIKKKIVL